MPEFNPLLIHKDNTPLKTQVRVLEKFDIETFDFGNSDLDTYISQEFIPKLQKKDFNILFIKDNLSDNYLELYGITLAYHIRLSAELGDKRFVPIVIISDIDGYILNKLTQMANILFTKNTFVARNEISSYDYFEKVFEQIKSNPLSADNFQKNFLDLIHIEPPQDYLSHHDITNEWSIYRWSEFLKVDTKATKANKAKIENMLYFKYLKARFPMPKKTEVNIVPKTPQNEGNILYIDDEWDKGWKDIFEKYFSKSKNIKFHFIEHKYKDTNYDEIETLVKGSLNLNSIDTVLLDMRLTREDHEQTNIEELSGIKLLKLIKSFNPGIQVILLTASEKSTILDEANKCNILGYIKKESASDNSTYTEIVFKKLKTLVDLGFERKYLKDIYLTKKNILAILENDIFKEYKVDFEKYNIFWAKLRNEVKYIFNILVSNNELVYAMLSITSSLEAITSIFLTEKKYAKNIFWDKEEYDDNRLEQKIKKLCSKLGNNDELKIDVLIKKRNDYLHANSSYVPPTEEEIQSWFNSLLIIIKNIQSPASYIPYVLQASKASIDRKEKESQQHSEEVEKKIKQKKKFCKVTKKWIYEEQ